jgi:hypothetical protein
MTLISTDNNKNQEIVKMFFTMYLEQKDIENAWSVTPSFRKFTKVKNILI